MIQFAAPSVASAPPSAPGPSSGRAGHGSGENPETSRFAQVLADHDDQAAPTPRPTTRACARPATDPAAAADPSTQGPAPAEPETIRPDLAARLPDGGKILPVGLPDLASPGASDLLPAAGDGPVPPASPTIPALLAAVRAISVGTADEAAATPAETNPAGAIADGDGDGDADADAAATASPAGALPVPLIALPVPIAADPLRAVTATQAEAVPSGSASPLAPVAPGPLPLAGAATPLAEAPGSQPAAGTAPALPPLIAAQMAGQPLTLAQDRPAPSDPASPQPVAEDPALALKIDPAARAAVPATPFTLEPAAARPMAGVRLRPQLAAEARTARTGDAAETSLDSLGPLTGSTGLATSGTVGATTAGQVPVARPHDFAGLVDRLMAARDAAQTGLPQSVHMSVNHADFGPISLNFQHDQAGLAVSVASADPDFARAVQAAIPAPGAATADSTSRDARHGSGQQGALAQQLARGDGSGGGDAGQRQPRGGTAFAPDNRHPAANRARGQDETGSRQRGIFA